MNINDFKENISDQNLVSIYSPSTRLLIVNCSQRKKCVVEGLAIDVYDGPSYRILRKYKKSDVDILILSAKYGLITHDKRISNYDQRMTKQRAMDFKDETTSKLVNVMKTHDYLEVYVDLGSAYRYAIDFNDPALRNINFKFNEGTIGKRLHNLKIWLCSVKNERNPPINKKDIN